MLHRLLEPAQYTSTQLDTVATEVNVRLSVGRTGVCWDNAQQESFWSTLEFELRRLEHFTTKAEAYRRVPTWIEEYCHLRRHSSLGMRSPVGFELSLHEEPNRPEQPAEPAA